MSTSLTIVPVPPDGDCFFHAFIQGSKLNTTPAHVRDLVSDYIKNDKDLLDDLITEWRDFGVIGKNQTISPKNASTKIRNGEWATSTMIHVVCMIFNVKIIVFENVNGSLRSQIFPSIWKPSVPDNPFRPEIFVLRRRNHFDLLVPKSDSKYIGDTTYNNSVDKILSLRNNIRQKGQSQRGGGKITESNDFIEKNAPFCVSLLILLSLIGTL